MYMVRFISKNGGGGENILIATLNYTRLNRGGQSLGVVNQK